MIYSQRTSDSVWGPGMPMTFLYPSDVRCQRKLAQVGKEQRKFVIRRTTLERTNDDEIAVIVGVLFWAVVDDHDLLQRVSMAPQLPEAFCHGPTIKFKVACWGAAIAGPNKFERQSGVEECVADGTCVAGRRRGPDAQAIDFGDVGKEVIQAGPLIDVVRRCYEIRRAVQRCFDRVNQRLVEVEYQEFAHRQGAVGVTAK